MGNLGTWKVVHCICEHGSPYCGNVPSVQHWFESYWSYSLSSLSSCPQADILLVSNVEPTVHGIQGKKIRRLSGTATCSNRACTALCLNKKVAVKEACSLIQLSYHNSLITFGTTSASADGLILEERKWGSRGSPQRGCKICIGQTRWRRLIWPSLACKEQVWHSPPSVSAFSL